MNILLNPETDNEPNNINNSIVDACDENLNSEGDNENNNLSYEATTRVFGDSNDHIDNNLFLHNIESALLKIMKDISIPLAYFQTLISWEQMVVDFRYNQNCFQTTQSLYKI